ncbi:hypothetical protein [Vibrio ouci]|uniref:Uncharacterized protein n=1 Tax=Vibrio ouci TaxID=2499078 RepID=A0A4Y8W7Q7_9VIBR|nr:hypothetical protein [Vibrio ouci]TFH88939.1 hypothetical protein ELS82_25100 [Vibrio ouci]
MAIPIEKVLSQDMVVKIVSDTDLFSIGSLFITALVVIATTYLTIKNFKTSMTSHQKTEMMKIKLHEKVKNRQQWIESVRSTVSEFCAVSTTMAEISLSLDKRISVLKSLEQNAMALEALQMTEKFDAQLSRALVLKNSLHLLLDPDAQEAQEVLEEIDSIYRIISDSSSDNYPKEELYSRVSRVIELTQFVVKSEWAALNL